MGELQPIAFLLPASLILAAFFNENSLSQKYSLFASLLFFLAYLGFVFYKQREYYLIFYWSSFMLLLGFSMLYQSFGGVIEALLKDIDNTGYLILFVVVILSGVLLISKYHIDTAGMGSLMNKIMNGVLYLLVIYFSVVYLVLMWYPVPSVFVKLAITTPLVFMVFSILVHFWYVSKES
jgi:hypothetical protein